MTARLSGTPVNGSPSLAFGSPGMTPSLNRAVSFPAGAKRRVGTKSRRRESTRVRHSLWEA